MNINILILSVGLLSTFSSSSTTLLDVKAIIGKNQNDVAKVIGSPTSCAKSKYGNKCFYSKGDTEIVFINGKADWVTIEALDHIPFDEMAIESIGLPPIRPSFKNSYTIRWDGVAGLAEVSIHKGQQNTDYAYIKAFTK